MEGSIWWPFTNSAGEFSVLNMILVEKLKKVEDNGKIRKDLGLGCQNFL